MTAIPAANRAAVRDLMQERQAEWLRRFYRHELLVARTVHGMQIEAQQEFARIVVQPLLKSVAGTIGTFEPRGSDLVPQLFPEIASLQAEIQRTIVQGSDAVRRLTEQRMAEVARQEVAWTGDTLRKLDPTFAAVSLPAAQATQAVSQRPWLGDSTERWFAKMLSGPTADNVRAWVNTGITHGLTTDEIVRGLRGTKTQTGILADKPAHAIAALVRTAATHVSSVARNESFRALGVTHYQFVATLDEKTSIQCASTDGKVFEIGKGPMPPLHPNCRSTTVPVWDPDEKMEGNRASVDGPVPASTTFREWLEDQPNDVQDEVLGKAKAGAWRSGKLSIERMLGADLEPLTLAELREMDRL